MADLKKIPFDKINDDIINMSFDKNPNIPTANYSEETLNKINEVLAKKLKAEKLQKMIETELKEEKKSESDEFIMSFNFGSM